MYVEIQRGKNSQYNNGGGWKKLEDITLQDLL